jgi:tetratricopeptide (TPR) repeat protein
MKNDYENAAKNLNESLRLRGRDSEALFLLGRTYEKTGRVEDSQKLIAQATRLSQRVERWMSQPIPKLERFATTTTFRSHDEMWNEQRLARRARGQGVSAWLDTIQSDIDSNLFGDALRELHDVLRVYPDSAEAGTPCPPVRPFRCGVCLVAGGSEDAARSPFHRSDQSGRRRPPCQRGLH